MKYVSNSWHALKIVFTNEIGNLCKRLGVDGTEVMEVFCRDQKLNISSAYLQPGIRVRGVVPAQGPASPSSTRATALDLGASSPTVELLVGNTNQVEDPALRRRRPQESGKEEDRNPRAQLQAGHRRSAREPDRDARRDPHRQGMRRPHPRSQRLDRAADRRHSPLRGGGSPTSPRSCATTSRAWRTPRCW